MANIELDGREDQVEDQRFVRHGRRSVCIVGRGARRKFSQTVRDKSRRFLSGTARSLSLTLVVSFQHRCWRSLGLVVRLVADGDVGALCEPNSQTVHF